jgi:hypothetical protein
MTSSMKPKNPNAQFPSPNRLASQMVLIRER